jgi:hypothetical protein
MNYIIILLVFLINYLIWKYLLYNVLNRVSKLSFSLETLFTLCIFLFIPYGVSLVILNYFDLSDDLLSNIMIVFGLTFISILTYKSLKNE